MTYTEITATNFVTELDRSALFALTLLVDDPNVDQEHLIAALECTGNVEDALIWLCQRDIVTPATLQQLEF